MGDGGFSRCMHGVLGRRGRRCQLLWHSAMFEHRMWALMRFEVHVKIYLGLSVSRPLISASLLSASSTSNVIHSTFILEMTRTEIHPLENPRLLRLVGWFLSLWEDHDMSYDERYLSPADMVTSIHFLARNSASPAVGYSMPRTLSVCKSLCLPSSPAAITFDTSSGRVNSQSLDFFRLSFARFA